MQRLKGAIIVGFLRLFALLPFAVAQRIGAALGWLMWRLPNRARTVTRINLQHCFPQMSEAEREALVRASLIDTGRSFAESACAWMWSPQRTLKLVREVDGGEILDQALASGKAVVAITSHLGNWEVLNHWYGARCNPVIFFRPPKQPAVDQLLRRQRAQSGNRVAPSDREGIGMVMREVRNGGAVGIPADPEPALKSGVFVPFFATRALTSKFVPGLLRGDRALAVFLHCIRLPRGQGFKVLVEAAPQALYSSDQQLAVGCMSAVIEDHVRRWPSQYMWSMKRFKKRPPGEPRWY